MTTPYNDLLQTTINNNVLRIDYQDNLNVTEKFYQISQNYITDNKPPYLSNRYNPLISINSVDNLLLSVQDPSGSYFQQYSLNNIIRPGAYGEDISEDMSLYNNTLKITINNTEITLYLNSISYDSQNRLIILCR